MNSHNHTASKLKKKSSLCDPSTTVLQKLDFGRCGTFAVIGGPKIGFSFELKHGDELIVGTSAEADIQLDCRGISRKHFCVYWSKNNICLKDLKSSNGTSVNKQKVKAPIKIQSGDEISVGATTVIKCS